VRAALNQVEQRRYTARHPAKPRTEEKGGLFQTFDLGEIRDAIAASYPSDTRIIGLLDRKNQDIQEGVTEVQNVLSRYSRLATLGSLIDRVLHDGRTVVARIKNISRFGKRDLQKKNLLAEEKIEIGIRSMDDAAVQAGMLSTLFNQIEPFGGRKRGRPKEYQIDNVIRSAIAVLQVEADDKGVELVALEGGSSSPVRLDEAEVLAVLVNLIQNGIYWAATRSKGLQRSVAVGARRNADDSLTLIVSDTGPGVEPEVRGHIFDPYFSSKPEGVGLGLSIVGNIVEDIYGGELALVEDGPLDGATFEATFRRRV
jgi:C4-dicarboxylate-specific signal transduction histidine kinase